TGDYEFMTRPSIAAARRHTRSARGSTSDVCSFDRSGTTVTAAASADGSNWSTIGSTTLNISSSALAGLVVCSVATNTLNTSTFEIGRASCRERVGSGVVGGALTRRGTKQGDGGKGV